MISWAKYLEASSLINRTIPSTSIEPSNLPGVFGRPFVALLDDPLVVLPECTSGPFLRPLDNVPVPLLPLVIPVDHKVGQVRDQAPSKPTRTIGKVDQFSVLRPLGLRGQDGFPKVTGSVGEQVGRERDRFDHGVLVELDVGG